VSPELALGLVAVLIIANGLFVAGEFALVSVNRGEIEERAATDRRARTVLRELRQLSFMLSGAQFGITATSLLVGFLAEDAVGGVLVRPVVATLGLPEGTERGVALATAFLLSTGVQMVLGELAPKNLAIARPLRVSLAVAPFLRVFGIAFGPVIRIFDAAAGWLAQRMFGVEVQDELVGGHTLDELSLIIEVSAEEGTLSAGQSELLARAVELGDRRVTEVMVPRPDVVWLPSGGAVDLLRATARETGHSRFPVRGPDPDDVVGTVHIKDLLRVPAEQPDVAIADLVVPALIVPESEPLRRLLQRFRAERRTFAIVVDEYGSVAGIVTLEDVLEQLVGDIEDEFDRPRATSVRRLGRGRYRLPGLTRLGAFARATGVELPEGDYETVAGFVMERLGHIPAEGEVVVQDDARITVTSMAGVRVQELEVVRGEDAS
jgi:CBS domain containing-hemolysin-like protein